MFLSSPGNYWASTHRKEDKTVCLFSHIRAEGLDLHAQEEPCIDRERPAAFC
jgi:hypothetical protein